MQYEKVNIQQNTNMIVKLIKKNNILFCNFSEHTENEVKSKRTLSMMLYIQWLLKETQVWLVTFERL